MKADRWHRVKELLNEALDREPSRRAAFLDEQCAGDAELRGEVDSLLASWDEADDFMEDSSGSPAPAEDRVQVPLPAFNQRIGPWSVIKEIGRGGMGTVYRAVQSDDPLGPHVALKIVKRGMDHDFILRRFRNERKILASFDHPNIAKLIDGGATSEGLPYFVMEFVDGARNILQFCDEERLGTEERLRLFLPVCSAVQAAHDRRIVHRDLKPGNILINSAGQPKLLDFGIAKILDPELTTETIDVTATILRLMTPEYASPEQVRGGEITAASDVYSLGVLLYELLTGHRPYRLKSRSPHEIAQVICEESPERPSTMIGRTELITRNDGAVTVTPQSVSAARRTAPDALRRTLCKGLDNIVLMAMRKQPERRYRSAAALAEDIDRFLRGAPVGARPETLGFQASRAFRKHRTAVGASLVTIAVGAALMFAWNDYLAPALRAPVAPPKIVPLTSFPGDETQPSFSPDGTRIAFVWEGEDTDNSDIYVKPVQGVGLERITTNSAEDLSPTWSPDGVRLAWLRANHKETAVYVSPAQPGQMHSMIASLYPNRIEAVGRHLDWAPDGKHLAAADKNNPNEPFRIVLIELATSNKTPLTSPPPGAVGDSSPAFSPDGRSVAFIRGVSSGVDDIFIKDIAAGRERQVTSDKRYIISLAWTADGKSIVFSSNRAGNHSFWRVPASGGTPERIGNTGDSVSDPVFSRNGRFMAFSQFYMDTNVWALDLETMARRKFIASTQYDSSPHYSRDGAKLVFRSSRSGTNEIWISDPDAMNPVQLTRMGNTLSGSPKLSPDGRRIAFDSRPDGQPDIFTINSDGTGLHRLTTEPGEDVVPNWSGDGQWIYFASNRSGAWQVWKIPAAGGVPVQVTRSGGFAARESPDGKWIYYARGRSVAGLWRIHPDGTGEQPVLERLKPGFWAYWAIARDGVYFADRDSEKGTFALYLLREGRREPQRIAIFDKPLMVGDQGIALSPDERTLLFTQIDQSGSDILMVEHAPGR
jgi:Tol biopolymer transport system component/serine/threonine protein kinase